MQGQIFKIFSNSYYVNFEGRIIVCKIRDILKKQKNQILTGDYVEFENDVIYKILPRKSYIKRPAVANVDQVVIVTSLKEPNADFHQLNRYIALAKYYKIPAILCFNKEDLTYETKLQDKIEKIYGDLGYKIVYTSALKKNGLEYFYKLLYGKLSALCGNSGVGKSSLINALNPNVILRTKSVSEKLERGRHTTRHSEIIPMDDETAIIDTPGFSNIKFNFIMPNKVDSLFDEIYRYKSGCKYSDCLHVNETECEVLKNIENIDVTRYESYLDFLNEAFEYKDKIKYNGTKEETSQKLHNNKAVVKISQKKRLASRNTKKQNLSKDFENGNE